MKHQEQVKIIYFHAVIDISVIILVLAATVHSVAPTVPFLCFSRMSMIFMSHVCLNIISLSIFIMSAWFKMFCLCIYTFFSRFPLHFIFVLRIYNIEFVFNYLILSLKRIFYKKNVVTLCCCWLFIDKNVPKSISPISGTNALIWVSARRRQRPVICLPDHVSGVQFVNAEELISGW